MKRAILKKSGLFLLSLGLLFSACEKDIQLNIPDQNKLVVLSNFAPDSLFRLYLSTSIPIGQSNMGGNIISPANASIQLYEDGDYVDDFTFHPADNFTFSVPYYMLDHKPKAESEYSIIANLPDYPEAKATGTAPEAIPIDDLEFVDVVFKEAIDDPGLFNYIVTAKLKPSGRVNTPSYFHLTAWQNGAYCYYDGPTLIKVPLKEDIGLALSSEVQHLVILHENGVLIDQQAFQENPEGIDINFYFSFDSFCESRTPVYLELRHVSADYYLFHKSVGEQEFSSVRESLLSTQSVLIHNNIEGGVGNFSGYAVARDSVFW